MKYLLLAFTLLGGSLACSAQATPTITYDFLTLLEQESQLGSLAKIAFAPAFQGKSIIELEGLPGTTSSKYITVHQRNLEIVNQQLTAITAAGWELVHVFAGERGNEYLFRKPKP